MAEESKERQRVVEKESRQVKRTIYFQVLLTVTLCAVDFKNDPIDLLEVVCKRRLSSVNPSADKKVSDVDSL